MSRSSVRRTLTPEERRDNTEDDVYLAALRRMIRAAAVRAGENIEALPGLIALADDLDQAIGNAVTQLRAGQEYSWSAIGQRAGITRQSAQERWGTP